MALFLFGISGSEIIIVFIVILVLFGADKIPDLARTIGKGMNEFKKATDEIKREIQTEASDIKDDLLEARRVVNEETHEIKEELKEPIGFDPYDTADESTEYVDDEPEVESTKKRTRKPRVEKNSENTENKSSNNSDKIENK